MNIAGAGDRVAALVKDLDKGGADPCGSLDLLRTTLRVQVYKRGVGGLGLEEEHVVAASVLAVPPSLTTYTQPALSSVGLRLGARARSRSGRSLGATVS